MIDFHNHILPNIDDGSKSLEMTINMLREAEKQGITDIVNTTHYKHPKMSNKNTNYRNVQVEIEKLQTIIKEQSISIKLHFGTEILFHNDLIKLKLFLSIFEKKSVSTSKYFFKNKISFSTAISSPPVFL